MFKRRTHTHAHIDTHRRISVKLSLLCVLFPFSLPKFIRVSVHVHLGGCVRPALLVCLIMHNVSAFAFCLCVIVCESWCVFCKEIKA